MISIKNILLVGLISLFSCQSASADITPRISKKYTNEEISNKIIAYKSSHDSDIHPTNILSQKLVNDFPNAHDIDWETAANVYKVEFEINRMDYEAYYDVEGELLMYTREMHNSELPAVIRNAAISKYADYKFDDIKQICRGTDTFYKIELKRNSTEIVITVNSKGVITNEYFD